MAQFERGIDSSAPCSGRGGTYELAVRYVVYGQLRYMQLDYGSVVPALKAPSELMGDAFSRMQKKLADTKRLALPGGITAPDTIAAMSILRICQRRRHLDGRTYPQGATTIERVAGLAIAERPSKDMFELEPLNGRERNFSARGIGYARRKGGGPEVPDLIHLAVAETQLQDYPVRAAIPTAVQARGLQPHVALHVSDGGEMLERIIARNELA